MRENVKGKSNILSLLILVSTFLVLLGVGVWMYFEKGDANKGGTGPIKELTVGDTKNATYSVWGDDIEAKLDNGVYRDETQKIFSTITINLIEDFDLDGKKEAIVVIDSSRADSTNELFLVTKEDGKVKTERIEIPLRNNEIGVRNYNGISVDEKGVIRISMDILAKDDAHCCPSIHETRMYWFRENKLVETSPIFEEKSTWKTYRNVEYGFEVKYPQNVKLGSSNVYASPNLIDEQDVEFFKPGVATLLEVEAQNDFGMERDLKEFAESFRDYQVHDTNPNISKTRKVGEMFSVSVSGDTAYAFTLTEMVGMFSTSGYTLGRGLEYVFVVAQNSSGDKYIIHYLENDLEAIDMFNSFKFTN